MNPGFKSDKPGVAPDGMALQPVYADEPGPPAGTTGTATPTPGPARCRQDFARTPAVDWREVRHRRTGWRVARDPHGGEGHLRRDPCRTRPHPRRGLDRAGLRQFHGRHRQARRTDADDLQPGDAGVAAGAPAGRTRARPDAEQPVGVGRRARGVAVRGREAAARIVAAHGGPDPAGAHDRTAHSQHHAARAGQRLRDRAERVSQPTGHARERPVHDYRSQPHLDHGRRVRVGHHVDQDRRCRLRDVPERAARPRSPHE